MRRRPRYQVEPTYLADRIWDAKVVTPLQLHRIVAWKSARGLAWVTLNTEDEIRLRSSECLTAIEGLRGLDVRQPGTDWQRWEDTVSDAVGANDPPRGLQGIGFPVASAVLALLSPSTFPVIDRWAMTGIYGRPSNNFQTARFYRHYTEQLVGIGHHYPDCATVHELDQAVMNAAMRCTHEIKPCDCLPFPVAQPPTTTAASG
jgi:hypothetical protein